MSLNSCGTAGTHVRGHPPLSPSHHVPVIAAEEGLNSGDNCLTTGFSTLGFHARVERVLPSPFVASVHLPPQRVRQPATSRDLRPGTDTRTSEAIFVPSRAAPFSWPLVANFAGPSAPNRQGQFYPTNIRSRCQASSEGAGRIDVSPGIVICCP